MRTSPRWSARKRSGANSRRTIAALAAFVISVTQLIAGASPALAAPGDADLVISKTANSTSALVGTAVEFTITITNAGPGDTTGVTVTDVLPAEFSFLSSSATSGPYNDSSGVWSIGAMPLGATQTLSITARADTVALATNTATISASDQIDPNPGNNSASAAVNIVTVPPAVCDTDDIIGISGDTIYSINTQTGVATAEFQTSFNTGNRNALASNRDLGMVYWGSGSVVYWWNPIDDTEGVLVDLTGQINGTLESAGATYHGGYYYFSTEISGNANGIYRIDIDSAGTTVVPGSLELLAANQPEDGLEAIFGRDMRPDYGDLTVLTVNGEPVMFGSVVDGFTGTGYWWSYNINGGTFSYIAQENNPNHVQLGTDLEGDTWGTAANGDLYSVNVATGELTFTGHAIGIGFFDLSGSFCVPPELADIDLDKTMVANADADGSSSVTTGDTLTYQFTATNTGNVVLTGVTITDPLPGMSGLSCSEPMPAGISSGETLTCTATYTVTAADQQNGSITNIASVVGTAPSGATVSDTASEIVVVAQPEVVITKTSDASGPVVAGQVINYTVTIDNSGVFPIDDISIVDPLPAGTSYVDESTTVTGWTGGTVTGSWSQLVDNDIAISNSCNSPTAVTFTMPNTTGIADVNIGFTATHGTRGQVRATLTSPSGTTVVLASGDSSDSDNNYDVLFDGDSTGPLDDNSSDDVTPADYERSVGISGLESLAGEPAAGTWTLAVCDTNPFWASGTFNQATLFIDGVASTSSPQVKDNLPGGAQPDLVDGVPAVLVDAADDFDLPVGESMTLSYQVQVGDQLDGSVTEILNEAMAFSEILPPTSGYVIDPIDFQPELQVVKTGPAGPVAVGETVTYTYTIAHTTGSDGSPVDVVINDDIIDLSGATLAGDSDGDGLLVGNETWVYTIVYTVPLATADPLVNVATVGGTDGNGDPITDATDDHSVDVDFRPQLTVTKVGGPDPAVVGDTVTYTYTVSHAATSDLSPVSGVTVVDSRGLSLSGSTGDTDGDGELDGDETWVYTATETVVAATPDPLTNDVTVDGTDPDGDPIPQATDSESVDIDWAPLLRVDKTGPATATIGETVTYTFSVSHGPASDGSPVTIDGVTDDVSGAATYVGGDDGDGLLEAAETWVYEASYTVTAADPDPLVNTVTVTSTDLDGETVPDATDSHSTDIDHLPVIVVNKNGPAAALVGDTVTYTFTVYHDVGSDGTPVGNVSAIDDIAGAASYVTGDDGDGLLESGETWVFTATYTIQDTDPDPLVNTATATGDDEDGDPTGDTDTHSTDVIQTASVGDLVWHDLDGDGTQDAGEPGLDGVTVTLAGSLGAVVATTVTSGGGSYSFTDLPPGDYTVDVDETTLPLTGPVLTTGTEPRAVGLAEGEANTDADFGYYEPVTIGDFVWDDLDDDGAQDAGEPGLGGATVRVLDDLGNEVGSAVTAGDGSYTVDVAPGEYDVVVDTGTLPVGYVPTTPTTVNTGTLASGDTFDSADFGAILPTYPISGTVWNDEDVDGVIDIAEPPLAGVTVELLDAIGAVVATTTTQADGSYSFPPVQNGDYTVSVDETTVPAGMASTTGNNPEPVTVAGGAVGNVDFGYVYPGTVLITKNPAIQQVVGGGTATFDITIINPGLQDLSNVTVTDPAAPNCDNTIGTLTAGASTIYSCTLAGVTTDFTNTATVAATDEVGNAVTDSDTADVDVIGPAVNIDKTPDSQTILTGDDATFTITVTNTGDVTLTDVTVTDTLAPDCEASFASLGVGAVETYSCTLTGVTADFTNTASVTGDDPLANPITDSDTADVDVIDPAIDIQKTPDDQTVVTGDDAGFTITVTNTGDVTLANVTVTDTLAPDCDAGFASLAVGAVETYSCTVPGATSDFTNTAAVTGDDPLGNPVTDSDTADVDVINPAIDIQKTPDSQQARAGDTVTFDITVTNTGDVGLDNVSVTDAQAPGCDAVLGSLAAGASTTYSCTVTAGATDFTNTAAVTGDDSLGNPVTDSDTADVDVIDPAIEIQKTPDSQQALPGGTVIFDVTVANAGDVELSNVAVTDLMTPTCNRAIGSLVVGETTTYSCSTDAGGLDWTNIASVTGDDPIGNAVSDIDVADVDVINPALTIDKTPNGQQALVGDTVTFDVTVTNTGDVDLDNVVVTDAQAPDCDITVGALASGASTAYSCSMVAGATDFTNTADVTGDDPLGNAVTDSDTADVDVINPAISIDKTPDTQQALAGNTVTFDITVTNTGDVDLTGVAVADALVPGCDNTIGALATGASTSYSCSMVAGADDFTNTAAATGDDPLGNPVTDSDTADVDVINPAISIDKTPDSQQALAGDTVTFDITVTNTGDVNLDSVVVGDTQAPDCDGTVGPLAVGASTTYSCSMVAGADDFTNTADVTGDDPLGNPVTDTDTADVDVISPAITIEKSPDSQQARAGDTVTFDITVTNTGDVGLTGVAVTDVVAPDCDSVIGALGVGASSSYSCSMTAGAVDFTNTADVTGDDPLGNPVTGLDTADVDVVNPAITVDKTPDTQQALVGDTVTFDITVTNTGDVGLTDIEVTDTLAPNCDNTFASLAAGAGETYTCTMTAGAADFTNTADVTADDPLGNPVTATDTADVGVVNPAITIEKSPDSQQALAGDTVSFDITVTNTGDVDLGDVTVTDALAPDCDATFASLGVGAGETYTCTMTAGAADFTNRADVTGDDPMGNPVTGSDTADVDVVNPAITIDKTPDTQILLSGDDAVFTITVTNTGDVDITGVTVTDTAAPDCDASFAALSVGDAESYSCTLAGVTADFTNTADVTGDDPLGNPVTDSDTADVDVIGPAITIDKTPDIQQAATGDTVTFDITVTNTGDVDLDNVVVTDGFAPDCDNTIGALATGASMSYSCSMVAGADDFTNTADVTSDDPLGNPVIDSDTAVVDVINPAITIVKGPDGHQVVAGGTVTFDITVTNTGDVDLTGVTVTDVLAPDCDTTFAALTAGASETYACTLAAGATDFVNTASATGDDPLGNPVTGSDTADVDVIDPAITIDKTPDGQQVVAGGTVTFDIAVTNTGDVPLANVTVTDGLAPSCDSTIGTLAAGASTSYSCSMIAGADDFTNTADVAGDDPLGTPVSDSDTADVDVVSPAIDIAKNPASQTILGGATATFTITVTNTGNVPLDNVAVTDALVPNCDATYPSLAAGESVSYNCTLDDVTADFTNIAVVSAEHPASPAPVTDSDVADVEVIAPEIDIQKTPDVQTILAGSDVTFTITVTNTGDAELIDIAVTDAQAPACDATFASLPIGAAETYDCAVIGVTADFTNVADVTADDPSGGTVGDVDDAVVDVIDPGITIDKTPETQTVLEGDDVTFTITVTNTGDVDLGGVTVTDAATPACDSTLGTLAAGETVGYDCTATAVTTGFTNVADVAGTDPLGNAVTDSDDAVVIVSAPAIEIMKTADTPIIISGGDATFTITVTNVGTELLTGVTVGDALVPDCDAAIGDLASGASTTYSCTLPALTADVTNTASVIGTHPLGGTVADEDSADVNVIAPAITITKAAAETQMLAGQDATFTITVENTGDVALTGVTVTDALAPDCDTTIGDLAVGQTSDYSCTVPAVTADFTNTASVVGSDSFGNNVGDSDDAAIDVINPAIQIDKTPDSQFVTAGAGATFTITVTNTGDVDLSAVTITDALVPACDAIVGDLAAGVTTDYTCDVTGVAAGFTNTASVVGTHPAGGTVTDDDTADVVVINPSISLTKDPALQQLLAGEDASFTITVTNTGDGPLTDVTISDAQAPGCETIIPGLGIGASTTVTCSVAGVIADLTNTASVVATHAAGGTVEASDSADVVVLVPQIDIQKTPDVQLAAPGSDVTFTITITNAGVVPLIDIAVTDAPAPACNTSIPALAVGESTSYDCTVTGVTADFTNTASVTATDTAGNPATDNDTADVDVVAPAITIAKTPDLQSVGLNGTPTFTISVTNTGDIDLTDIVVTDTLAPACDATFASLPVGATETYTCDGTATAADFTNTAAAGADSPVGPVSDSDTADVTVLLPGIDIQKTPDSQLVGPGGTATFTITVTNAGATPLSNITVGDPLAPVCDNTIAALAIGESTSYECDVTGITADFTNTASVTAEDPLGNAVSDSDTADVDFVDPAITVTKTPDLQTLLTGEDASFTIAVTNSGDTDLTNVVLSDPLAPGCDATFVSLAIGAAETVSCSVTGVSASFINVATATADTPVGTQVSDSDDALVALVTPGVEIYKTPDVQQIHSGDDVTFNITVTNTGDQDLVNLTVTDPATSACDGTIAALAVGESTSYDCTATGVTADFTNIASVAGTDVLGNPVSDSDDAQVDVINPALDVQKTPDLQAVVVNGTATFSITATNTGDVELTGVTVSDPVAPNCDATIGDLAVGESSSATCSLAGVTADFTNTATVSGVDPIGASVSDSDTADVTVVEPGIEIQKTPDLQQTRAGDTVDFTITVTNTGGVVLSNVAVTDTTAPACDSVVGGLAVGETTSYTCSTTAGASDFTNTAGVTGDDPIGNPVSDSDTADVDVIAPAISIRKSPDGQTVVSGDSATFTIEVANSGDVDLTGVTVTDALVPACDSFVGDLAVGESTSYACTVSDVATDFTNTAVAGGTDPIGLLVTDSDTADVTVLVPGLGIEKTPDTQTVVEGDAATFTIIVTNTGQTDLFGVTVTDPLVPACDNVIGNLPVGSTPVTYTCTAVVTDDFTNTATAVAIDPLGNDLTDEDTADVVALGLGNISGTVAHDVAGDGVIDAGDIGVGGIPMTATWVGLDGVFGTADDEMFNITTGGNGDYGFSLVPPGEYRIVVDTAALPSGVDFQTVDPDATLDSTTTLTLAEATSVTGIDFAYTATGSIGDLVFFDLDANGAHDPDEPGIGGVDVTVAWFGPDGVIGGGDDLVFTTTTGPDGSYLVDGLPAGEFSVVIGNVPAGLTGATSQSVTMAAAEARDDVDFPLVGSGVIGDQVFEDVNRNGVFDSGEPGVAGVGVTVTWAGGDGLLGTADDILFTTVTAADGQYLVETLPAGDFLVEVDDTTIPVELGTAPPVSVDLDAGETDLEADFPLVGNRPPVAVDDEDITDEDTPVVIAVLDDDSDPDGHDFAISDTTDPLNGAITVIPDGTITYTPNPGFVGVDTFTYTICEVGGPVGGVPATGLCDTATVTVTIVEVNEPPGPEASFQSVVVGDPLSPMPVFDPDGGPVTVRYISGDLPPGITLNDDGSFSGVTEQIGTYQIVVEVCDDDVPQICIIHTHTIAVTPVTLPGPEDPPDDDDDEPPPDTLPFTGANFGELVIAALLMLSAGAGMVLYTRKRRQG